MLPHLERHVATIIKETERGYTQPSHQPIKNDHVNQKMYNQESQRTYIQNSKILEPRQHANLTTL